MYFTADDEADASKAQVSKEMRERLGIYQNPLDEHMARVGRLHFEHSGGLGGADIDIEIAIHVSLLPQDRIDTIPYPRWPDRQLAPV